MKPAKCLERTTESSIAGAALWWTATFIAEFRVIRFSAGKYFLLGATTRHDLVRLDVVVGALSRERLAKNGQTHFRFGTGCAAHAGYVPGIAGVDRR